MVPINYVNGDATAPQGPGAKIICHICNDIGGWGAGFVLAISKRWKAPRAEYRAWYEAGVATGFELGKVQFVQVEPTIFVANMIGQRDVGRSASGSPIRYDAVAECLKLVAVKAKELGASVHMPRIGCGLAGGDWSKIELLVQEHLADPGIAVTVYDFG